MKRFLQITLLLAGLAWCVSAQATITKVQDPAGTRCTAASGQCLQTVTATGAGHLLVMEGIQTTGSAGTISSCCSSGCSVAWVQGPHVHPNNSAEQWYCLSSSAGATSIGPTWSVNCSVAACVTVVREFSTSLSSWALDTGATPTCTGSGTTQNPVECALTVSATNAVHTINAVFAGTLSACSQTYTCTFPTGGGEGYKINQTAYNASTWTGNASNAYSLTAMAVKEVSATTSPTMPPAVY